MVARVAAQVLGCLLVAAMLAYAVAAYAQDRPAPLPPPLPACPTIEDCPVPSEVATLLQDAGEYGLGDYPPCVEIRAGGQVCVMPAGQPHPAP